MKLILKSIICLLIMMFVSCSNETKWINSNIDGNLLVECPSIKDDFYQAVNYDINEGQTLVTFYLAFLSTLFINHHRIISI